MSTGKILTLGLLASAALLAGGGSGGGNGGGGGGVPTPGVAEVRSLNERIPAGGTVQAKYLLTTPRPISGGGPKFGIADFSVNGVAITSLLGDAAGVGYSDNGVLTVEVISPNSDYGLLDYPLLTIAMTIPPSTKTGSQFPLAFPDTVYQTPTGPVTLSNPKPGTLTVGGSVSIHGVLPGGGTWPSGTLIRVQGSGFVRGTKLLTKMRTTTPFYVSSTEMGFYLVQETPLDSQPVTVQNPDGSTSTFYSYLRGVPVSAPSRSMLRKADPIFQTLTHGFATVDALPVLGAGQFMALAVQNPTPGPVVVTFYHQRSGTAVPVTLPSGGRVMDELSALFGGLNLLPGDVISVNSTSGVQILGIAGDEAAGTLKPWLPQF